MRICKKCNEEKKLEEFVKTKDCFLGYRHECKECHNKKYIAKGPCKDNSSWFKKGHKCLSGSEKGWFKKGNDNSKAIQKLKGKKPHNFVDGKCKERAKKLRNQLKASEIKKLRLIALVRDENRCTICKTEDKRLHMHHIIPIRVDMNKAYDLDNVTMLCPKCHATEERRSISLRTTDQTNPLQQLEKFYKAKVSV